MDGSFVHARNDELRIGLDYARDKFCISLDRDMLRTLFNNTLEYRARTGCSFSAALHHTLQSSVRSATMERYSAYKAAVGKMANRRRTLASRPSARPSKRRRSDELKRLKDDLALGADGRQLESMTLLRIPAGR